MAANNGTARPLDLAEYVADVERELVSIIGRQREVLARALEERRAGGQPIDHCGLFDCRPLRCYREAVQEAVRVLDETRRSFKSRQLEQLRKRLEAVLAEDSRQSPVGSRQSAGGG